MRGSSTSFYTYRTMGNIFKLKGKTLFRASTAMAGTGFLLFGYDQVSGCNIQRRMASSSNTD